MNRTVVEKARYLLIDEKLEMKFGAEALNTALWKMNWSFAENDACDLVGPPQEGIIADNKLVFKRKIDSAGNACYRARVEAIPLQVLCLNCQMQAKKARSKS